MPLVRVASRIHDPDASTSILTSSTRLSLCRLDMWTELDVDGLAQLYDSEITAILDSFRSER